MAHGTPADLGVAFAQTGNRRSSTHAARAIVADALGGVDQPGAIDAAQDTDWRHNYPSHFRRLIQAGLRSPEDAVRICRDGLSSVSRHLVFATEAGDRPLSGLLRIGSTAGRAHSQAPFTTESVHGTAAPETELVVPYGRERLSGDALRRQVAAWVQAGVAEPGLAEAIDDVIAHPEWLSLPDHRMVVLGAAAEMGPLRPLLRWGAQVAVVDLPEQALWASLLADVRQHAGTVLVPTRVAAAELTARCGANVVTDVPSLTEWVHQLPGQLVIGNYAYADSAMNLRIAAAIDQLTGSLRTSRTDTGCAFLATPTDTFVVPPSAVAAATLAYNRASTRRWFRAPIRTLSGGRLLRRNYRPDALPGINDSIVPQQGPNYLLGKRIHRWRAATARASGGTVSFTVAPPTRTRSVLRNKAFAAAYAGAHRFGVEVFDPDTASTLMAALLVRNLHVPQPLTGHPWLDEAYAAVHGGLWRSAYSARSALGLAAVLGVGSGR